MTQSHTTHSRPFPQIMYGTAWKEGATAALVTQALECGFRAIDTANQRKHYFEEGVGLGLASFYENSSIERKELFLQTKFTYARGQDHRKPYDERASYTDQVHQSFESSLKHLKTDYIDSYILHGPLPIMAWQMKTGKHGWPWRNFVIRALLNI